MPKVGESIELTKDNIKDVLSKYAKNDKMFVNSECVFVEYYDIIKCPWYILLTVIHQNEKVKQLLDLTPVEYLDSNELFEWYCNRKYRNFLFDLASAPIDKVDYDMLLTALMSNNEIFYQVDTRLNAVEPLKEVLRQKMMKKLIIYTEEKNDFVKEDITNLFGNKSNVLYYHGEFDKVLDKVPSDTTYFLSDFNKVVTMAEKNRLNLASLVLPYDFGYNYYFNDKNERTSYVDFTYLGKDHLFKVNYFNSCYV